MTLTDPAWLDAQYNNRVLVPEHATFLGRWPLQSAVVRDSQHCALDIGYGDAPSEALDVFPADPVDASGAPVLVFIHGGYWRALDKADHSFVAPAFTAAGICVVVPNYTLCPATTIPGIVDEMQRALDWVACNIAAFGGDASRVTVAGHSAGGQLAAMLLACGAPMRNALGISGLYDLDPIRRTPFLQADLRLTAADVELASPVRLPAPVRGELHTVVGALESTEYIRQNALPQAAWGTARVPVAAVLPGLHHFSIVDALADRSHALHRQAVGLLHGADAHLLK